MGCKTYHSTIVDMSDSVLTPGITSDIPKPIEPGDGDTTGPNIENILTAIEEVELPPSLDGLGGYESQSLSILTDADQAFTNCGSIQYLSVM